MAYTAIAKDDLRTCLMHYGVKGMKWGVRRYQDKDGHLTTEGKKRRSEQQVGNSKKVDKKHVLTKTVGEKYVDKAWNYENQAIKYENKNGTSSGKKRLDNIADKKDYYEADRYDRSASAFLRNCREKGEEYAQKVILEEIGDTPFQLITYREKEMGEEYVTYTLSVYGNKNIYTTFGEENYSDDQHFSKI